MTEMRIPKPSEIPCNKTVYIGRLKIRGTKPLEPADAGADKTIQPKKDHKKPSKKDDKENEKENE
jgi:hypothetical protein